MISGNKEFLIYNKKAPLWDRKRHFWEQTPEVLAFYDREWEKITKGLTIDGVFIHPWLYFHANYFKTPIPQKDGTEPIINPYIRDNEWFFMETLMEAQEAHKAILLFGSRRFSKSVIESSFLQWNAMTKFNTTSEIICGSDQDLKTIARFLQLSHTNMHPAFYLTTNKKDWGNHIQYGFKEKGTEDPVLLSEIFVKNADAGKAKASEKGAGGAPACVIIDEVGKFSWLSIYLGLLPAIETPYGLKATILLSGTSGNELLSADTFKVLANPTTYKILPMNWDTLEKYLDPENITWKRKLFGTFVPAQMSYAEGLEKIDSNIADFLKLPYAEGLKKIPIQLTDWKKGTELFLTKRKELEKDPESLAKEIMYRPLDPDDCLMSGTVNPFPVVEARKHYAKIIEEGDIGKAVEITRNENGTLGYELSSKQRLPYPFAGGIHDAPVVIYTELPKEIPEYGENTSGFDPYKAKESTTDSAGAFYVVRRKTDITMPIEEIILSYATRPKTPRILYRNVRSIIKGLKAECLYENADQGFIQYLDETFEAESLLANGVDWSKAINPKANPKTLLGFYPTPKNINYLFSLVLTYTWEEVVVGVNEEGEPIVRLGVTFIKDPELLQEIINYKDGGNFDRIRAFGAALAWAKYLDTLNVQPRKKEENKKSSDEKRRKAKLRASGFIRAGKGK